jgi:cytochrome P450
MLLVLAAANRDPACNPEPDRFLADRPARRIFGFGHGPHACPGQALALDIAGAALATLAAHGGLPRPGAVAWTYRPSLNGRIPVFTDQ